MKIVKWIGIVTGALIGLVLVIATGLYLVGIYRLNKTYNIPKYNVPIPTDAASIARGKHRVETMCISCHGENLSGVTGFASIPAIVTLDSANLTSGEGGKGREYKIDQDYTRAIRHGVNPEGKFILMPAVVPFQYISDEDLGAIIAYLKTLPPVDHKTNGHQISALGTIMIAAGIFGKLPVEAVSHAQNVSAPPEGVTLEYGEYIVNIVGCRDCHGQPLSGGPHPDPSLKVLVPNITPGGEPGLWSEQDFLNTIRSGTTPSGRKLSENMPLSEINNLTDDELKAIWLYLGSLPKLEQVTMK